MQTKGMNASLEKASIFFIAMMVFVPFLIPHHLEPLATFYNEYIAIGFGVMAMLLLLRPSTWQDFQYPRIASMPIAFAILVGIQWALGMDVYWQQHLMVIFYFLWAAILVIVGSELRKTYTLEKIVPTIAMMLLGGALMSAVLVWLQLLKLDHYFWIFPHSGKSLPANIAQVNQLANYLGLGLASLMYLYATQYIKKLWVLTGLAFILTALALTGARMGWLYVAIISFVFTWFHRRQINESTTDQLNIALWLIPAFGLIQIFAPLAISLFPELATALPLTPTEKAIAGLSGQSIRVEFIKEAWAIFTAHPWLGVGWGQFGWQDIILSQAYPNHTGWTHHSHNIIAQLLAECGIFGGLILIMDSTYWGRQFFRQSVTAERLWILALVAIIVVHSLLEYPLWYAYFLGLFAVLLGLGSDVTNNKKTHISTGVLMSGIVLAFSVITFISVGLQYSKLENWYQQGLHGRLTQQEVVSMLNQMTHMRKTSLLAPQMDMVLVRALPEHGAFLATKIQHNAQVMHYRPGDQEMYNQAYLLALSGQGKAATEQLKYAMARYPEGKKKFLIRIYPRIVHGDLAMVPLIEAMSNRKTKQGVPIISMPGFNPEAQQ